MSKYDDDLPESSIDTSRVPGDVSGTLPDGIDKQARNARTQAIAKGQAQNAQNATQLGARNADKAKAANIQRKVNAQAMAKQQAQNVQAQSGKLGLTKPAPKSKPTPKPQSTGNKALDTMQQIKQEKQPQNSDFYIRYDHNGKNPVKMPKDEQPQTMYDRNGNRIIQGNGTFERRQRQAAGQDQQFQNPTGYDIGAVTNQVSQNSQPPVQASGMFGRTYDNRRFNNAMGYLNKTFTGKKVTLDDGSQVDASQYFQDNLNRILKGTNNPKALKFYLRSLQEDMARRGVGNFDISGELLKGTGMTDGGFAKYMWNNRNQFMTQEQRPVIPSPKPTGGSGKKVVNDKPKNYTVPDGAAQRNANMATGAAAKYGAQANMHPRVAKTKYMPGSYDDNLAQQDWYNSQETKFLREMSAKYGTIDSTMWTPAERKTYSTLQSHIKYWQDQTNAAKENQKKYGDWYNPGQVALGVAETAGSTAALGGSALTGNIPGAALGATGIADGARRTVGGLRKKYTRSNE